MDAQTFYAVTWGELCLKKHFDMLKYLLYISESADIVSKNGESVVILELSYPFIRLIAGFL